ncbi:hypothetical protein AVEN_264704-1 [Araneus ventricosus]|uniref:Reverse transcriptase domain-containing protein n=1 Tax=Araneus ventricosus TaxID=182803 RepID=A0A4Y2TLQ6_ARAVE|nr:hypothetical protein AVEN_151757-1 [Araneus ventricosus]GBO01558.1 hypothetical protein AVEN_167604-1 [Araneus ventricosus]GBO01563.1 hypothetical protein AVEN_264704-1 [Araneus ventricosus]
MFVTGGCCVCVNKYHVCLENVVRHYKDKSAKDARCRQCSKIGHYSKVSITKPQTGCSEEAYLDKKSSYLTTFIIPFGRFRFQRLSFGISSAPEHFQRRMSQMLEGIPGTICHMDDILIWGSTKEEHDQRLT